MYKLIWSMICLMLCKAHLCSAQSNQKNITHKSNNISSLEGKIIDTIANLPEVKADLKYVSTRTKGNRNFQYAIWEKPTKPKPYYWIRVMEDNGVAYHDHFDFFVYPKNFFIQFYNIANDTAITLSEWRKNYKK